MIRMKLIASVILILLITTLTSITSTTITLSATPSTLISPLQNTLNDHHNDTTSDNDDKYKNDPAILPHTPKETLQHYPTIQSLYPLVEEEAEGGEEDGEEGGNLSALIIMLFFIFAVLIVILIAALVTEVHEIVCGCFLRCRAAEREPKTESQHFENELASTVYWNKLPPGTRSDNII